MPAETKHPHRFNLDGTWDSICTRCFMTIANCNKESELEQFEKSHVCYESSFLAERGHYFIDQLGRKAS